jgi:hypothetical protein
MQAVLGRVFRQSGVLLKALVEGLSVQATVEGSEAAATGSFHGVKSFTDGSLNNGQLTVPTSVLSPVSDSNLVFVRETVTGTAMSVTALSVLGVWV